MSERLGARIHITGVVQGVGFRPFVYGLARRYALTGWVRNTSAGVDIEADGSREALAAFTAALRGELPPLAHIDQMTVRQQPANGFAQFQIVHSQPVPGAFQPISADVALCDDCLHELFSPDDRRYRYPFINCTNCGPRFTIIRDIPYDRPQTTMAPFALCPACAAEYANPLDRRFHAQPVACPVCGPHIWLEESGRWTILGEREEALQAARRRLREGQIVAIKGLGGFHLACDAGNSTAITKLRQRKHRPDKPFALMVASVEAAARHCLLDDNGRALLQSRARPIVILPRRPDSPLAGNIAPGQRNLGVMLPYTPLHHLLLEAAPDFPDALVMTSGNLSEEPIASDNEEARQRLGGLADAFLLHNRDIHIRCDDSVARPIALTGSASNVLTLRRARGFAPAPLRLPWSAPPLLAVGAALKNTFCLTRDRYAFLSHHIGDLENYETLTAFMEAVAHYEQLFRARPQGLAHDLHPDYLATRYAVERAEREGLPAFSIQHHHAHIAAALAEHQFIGDHPVIGVAFDGTGYGDDGAIWGGEFLIADYGGYRRVAHLAYVPLPGGDKAVREPWRMALAWLDAAGIPWAEDLPPVRFALRQEMGWPVMPALRHQLRTRLNAPLTSSAGRLFDAAAALLGVRQTIHYEAQAAIELETLADITEQGHYSFADNGEVIDPAPILAGLVGDWRAGISPSQLAARFHNSVAALVCAVCVRLRQEHSLQEVALSGGVWQNVTLLRLVVRDLRRQGFTVICHERVPANDGGIALGQAAIAAWRWQHGVE